MEWDLHKSLTSSILSKINMYMYKTYILMISAKIFMLFYLRITLMYMVI